MRYGFCNHKMPGLKPKACKLCLAERKTERTEVPSGIFDTPTLYYLFPKFLLQEKEHCQVGPLAVFCYVQPKTSTTAPLWPVLTIHNIGSDSSISFIKTCLKISPLDFWAYTQRNNLYCDKQITCPELCSTCDMSQSIHFFGPLIKYVLNAYL